MDPSAQGTGEAQVQLPLEGQGVSASPPITSDDPQAAQAQQQSAVQKRIDELTARSRDFERQNAELNARAQEQSQMLAAILAQRSEPAPRQAAPEVPEGMDPATAQYMQQMFERSLDARMRPLLQQLGQVQGSAAAQQAASAASQYGAQVQARAAQLAQAWQAKGLTGFTPEDAAIYAAGEEFRRQQAATNASRTGAQGFAAGLDMPGARGAPGVSGGAADAPIPEWADFNSDSYNPHKGPAFWEARARASLKR